MNTLSPQSRPNNPHVLTGTVQPTPSAEVLATFGREVPNGLTPHEQMIALQEVIRSKLSDRAIAGHDAVKFTLGEEDYDPSLWSKVNADKQFETVPADDYVIPGREEQPLSAEVSQQEYAKAVELIAGVPERLEIMRKYAQANYTREDLTLAS